MVGQNIGKYRVLERIGRGGMGTVYRALDETLHRDVAIKVLNAELNDPEVAKRFRAEAITVARLSHPGIATIYELFQSDGQWLMVMEFVRGETLEHLVARMGPLSPQRTAEISMQALGALAHAHSMGVVHRDLKPANIMITDTGVVKIMDFGIARVAGTEHLTNAGFMMGTPAYMAPEQVLGRDIDARADIYAMGVVFYRLTTSKLPFKGDTPFAMAQSQVNDPPTPISLVRNDLPPWVEEVTSRALAKSPDDRFQSAVEFHESLARCLAGLPLGPVGASSSATAELLMTPPRAMPTGSIRSTLPPLTGAPPTPSGTQPVGIAPSVMPTVAAPAPSASTAEFDASAATVLAPSPSGAMPISGPPSGPVIAQASLSGSFASSAAEAATMPVAAPTSEVRAVMAPTPTAGIPVAAATPTATVPSPASAATAAAPMATSAAPVAAAKKSGGIGVLWVIGAVVVIGGAAAFWFMSRQAPAPPPVEQAQAAPAASEPAAPVMQAANAAAATAGPAAPAPQPAGLAAPNPAASTTGGRATNAGRAAAAQGRSTTAATATATTTAAATSATPAPVVPDTPVSFDRARLLVVNGRKTDDQEITLWFANGHINALAKKGQQSIGALPYGAVAGATYLRAKDPKWDASLASPPANIDVGGILRGDKNWLVVQGHDNYLIFRLDDANARAVLDALASKTNVTISYPKK